MKTLPPEIAAFNREHGLVTVTRKGLIQKRNDEKLRVWFINLLLKEAQAMRDYIELMEGSDE